jgi:hypothetical protein
VPKTPIFSPIFFGADIFKNRNIEPFNSFLPLVAVVVQNTVVEFSLTGLSREEEPPLPRRQLELEMTSWTTAAADPISNELSTNFQPTKKLFFCLSSFCASFCFSSKSLCLSDVKFRLRA